MKVKSWFQAIEQCHLSGKSYVLVTLLASAGSTPRSQGTKMVITEDQIFDTIGGGHLEYDVISKAKKILLKNQSHQSIEHYPLSSKLGQCCGGATNVLFELINEQTQSLWIFGAGHVARALVPIVAQLPYHIRWIDNRKDMIDSINCDYFQNKVTPVHNEYPADEFANKPTDTNIIVMTHSHELDFEIIKKALSFDDLPFLGMIGSDTKARRFRSRLSHQGFSEEQINRLTSPIGIAEVPGKKPIEVAVSIAGQLIQQLHAPDNNISQDKLALKQAWLQTKKIADLL